MTSHAKARRTWKVQDAKARFSEMLDTALREGPQIVSRRGVSEAVLVPMEEWERLRQSHQPSLKDFLLSPEARFELEIPPRRQYRTRPPVELD